MLCYSSGMLQGCTGQDYCARHMIDEVDKQKKREKIMAPVDIRMMLMRSLAGCPALSFYSVSLCLHLTDLPSISGHSKDCITMHRFHCQPNTILQQLDLIRNKTINLGKQCIRPSIKPYKQYLVFMHLSPIFFQNSYSKSL